MGGQLEVKAYLLDTHVLYRWLAEPAKLDKKHAKILAEQVSRGTPVSVSAITLWEIASLSAAGRLPSLEPLLPMLTSIENHPLIDILPLTAAVGAESASLGRSLHGDPADRIIVATASVHGLILLTQDSRIIESGLVRLA